MKNQLKAALLTVAVAAAAFSSQAATYNGDLIIGFTVQSGNDLMYDLGSVSSLVNGETWNLNSLLGASLNTSTVKWGVIGTDYNNGKGYSTKVGVNTALTANKLVGADTAITGMVGLFGGSGIAGPSIAAGQSLSGSSTLANNWNPQTTGSAVTAWKTKWENPNTTGYSTVSFFQATDAGVTTQLGSFSFANDGIVTYNAVAVPEPATYGALAGAGLLIVSLRNQFRRKQA